MFASIREYLTRSSPELTRQVQESLLPLLRKLPGFVAYYAVDAGGGAWVSVSIFETQPAAEAADRLAGEWVARHVPNLLLGGPEVSAGPLVVREATPALRGSPRAADASSAAPRPLGGH